MSPRLSLALAEGLIALPEEGDILVDGPDTSFDVAGLRMERLVIRQGFRPDFEVWEARGYRVTQNYPSGLAATIVVLPRSKDLGKAMIAEACASSSGFVIVDGAKTNGVDSLLREVRKRCPVFGPVNKAHGKLFWFEAAPERFDDWQARSNVFSGLRTMPGVFSADGIDPASRMLLDHLPDQLGPRVADLGAGWGYLSAQLLAKENSIEVMHLVEADWSALECARANVTDPRAQFHWADARKWSAPEKLSAVVMNPPFHVTRAADPGLGQAFISNAARLLATNGGLWLVANRHLPYEATLVSLFRDVAELGGDARFKVLQARRPKQKRSSA